MAGEYLWVTEGNAAGTTIAVDDDFVIGRAEAGDGKLGDDPEISRAHARFYRDPGGQLIVMDLGSTNGTFVNGTQISAPEMLQPGDQVLTGQTTIQVEAAPTTAGAPTPSPPPAAPTTVEPTPAAGGPPPYEPPPTFEAPPAAAGPGPGPGPGQKGRGPLIPILAGLGALLVIGAIIAVVLLAGGDDDGGDGGGLTEDTAEETVVNYLRGFAGGDGEEACDQLTEDYQDQLVEDSESVLDETPSNCEDAIDALHQEFTEQGGLTFEGEELTEDNADDFDFDIQTEGEESATVTGPKEQQEFELEPDGDNWKITDINSI